MSDINEMNVGVRWYVAHTYSGYENKVKANLEKIIELRNISTHYITEDYEQKYAPLFQACVLNYVNELQRFHGVCIADHISQNFLTITTNYEPLDNEQIRLKYTPEVAEKLIRQANEIDVLNEAYNSEKFSINIRQNLYVTKHKDEADFVVSIEKGSDNHVALVKELKDPANSHKYSYNLVITVIRERMTKEKLPMERAKPKLKSVFACSRRTHRSRLTALTGRAMAI